jgi:hypothetical protein
MRKTGEQIVDDIYEIVNESALKTAITGIVYKDTMRPIDAKTEDIVVSFLTGINSQIQTGAVNVNIYVPDIDNGGKVLVKNIPRCRELGIIANTFIEGLKIEGYKFEDGPTIQTFKADGTNQHFINCKIKFQLITF